jgi:hypothetical protein
MGRALRLRGHNRDRDSASAAAARTLWPVSEPASPPARLRSCAPGARDTLLDADDDEHALSWHASEYRKEKFSLSKQNRLGFKIIFKCFKIAGAANRMKEHVLCLGKKY